jgi:hypothetical protein
MFGNIVTFELFLNIKGEKLWHRKNLISKGYCPSQ